MFCRKCGKPIDDGQEYCANCQAEQTTTQETSQTTQTNNNANTTSNTTTTTNTEAKSKMAAGLLGIFLGYLGIHNFYLGNTSKAVAQLLLTLLGWIACGIGPAAAAIWGLIEGIMILTGSINTDANGNPLKD